MAPVDAPPAASSADPTVVNGPELFASLTPAQRSHWELTGDLPEPTPSDASVAGSSPAETPPAAPSAATPDPPAPSTEGHAPASEPGKSTGHPGNTDTRIQELLSERAQLRQRLEALERAHRQPATAPEAEKPFPATYEEYVAAHPNAPYEQYVEERAIAKVEQQFKQREAEQQALHHAQALDQAHAARMTTYEQTIKTAADTDPELKTLLSAELSPEVLALRPLRSLQPTEAPTPYNAICEEVLHSQPTHQALLLKHFLSHPEDVRRIAASPSPRALIAEVAFLAAKLELAATTPAAPQITKAPAPPEIVGRRPAQPVDALEAALARGDQRAYEAEANRRDIERAQRGH